MKDKLDYREELPKALREAISQHPYKKLFQEEEAILRQKEQAGGGAKVISLYRRRLAYAAIVFLAVGFASYYLYVQFQPPSAIAWMEVPVAQAQASSEDEATLKKGKEAFSEKNYSAAIEILSRVPLIPDGKSDYYEAQFLLAHALHHEGEYLKAIPVYSSFLENDNALLSTIPGKYYNVDKLRWNLVLACWGSGQKERALKELEQLKTSKTIGNDLKEKIKMLEKQF